MNNLKNLNNSKKSIDNLFKKNDKIMINSHSDANIIGVNNNTPPISTAIPASPFQIISKSNDQFPYAVEQTSNCKLTEPLSPFAIECNNTKFSKKKSNTGLRNDLKILTTNSDLNSSTPNNDSNNQNHVPISPFNLTSPKISSSSSRNSLLSKGSPRSTKTVSQLFYAQADIPIIPQVNNNYNNQNRSSWINNSLNSMSASLNTDIKREPKMCNINTMVTNVRKEQETNAIDKILFDTQYSGIVDQNIDNELIRHNNRNKTLIKCFSRSSSGIFSFKPNENTPNSNTIYYIDTGNEPGTSIIHKKDNPVGSKTNSIIMDNILNSDINPSNISTSTIPQQISNNTMNGLQQINEMQTLLQSPSSPRNINNLNNNNNMNAGMVHTSPVTYNEYISNPQNNNKLTSTFSYDPEYIAWREAMIEVLKDDNNENEKDDVAGSNNITSFYHNINNSNQIDYSLRMPIELLTILNTNLEN